MNDLTEPQVIEMIARLVSEAGGLRKLSLQWGDVSAAYICYVLKGQKRPGPAICRHLGLRRETSKSTVYRRENE
jgi:hypothetical protein